MKRILLTLSTIGTIATGIAVQSGAFAQEKTISSSPSYRMILEDSRWPDRPFAVDIPSSNTEGVENLEGYIGKNGSKIQRDRNGKITNLDDLEIGIVHGIVEKTTPSRTTHDWNFRLVPETVKFSDFTIELCDANFNYVEKNLDQWMVEVKAFCPWNTRQLVKDIVKIDTK